MKNYQKISIAAIVLCAVAVFAVVIVNNYKTKTSFKHSEANAATVENSKTEPAKQDAVLAAVNENAAKSETPAINNDLLKVSSSDIIYGDKNAPVVMIEYSSLSCPHCAAFNREAFEKIKSEYIDTKKVQFIHRDFPLNQPALAAAMFASCQAEKNPEKYYTLIKALFKTQDSWAFDQKFMDKLQSIAKLDGMSFDKFNACVNDKKLQEKILKDRMETSQGLQIRSTPTFFINGEMSEGYVDYVSIKKIIDIKLAESSKF
ncbi:MAG: DsbA family protein [Rickettsiales bacterium]|nr:DsbA family protein [Rickettsiales bacterium]